MYMHHDSFMHMQNAIDECLQNTIVEKIQSCDAYSLITDERTNNAITKKLVLLGLPSNHKIADGRAETIMDGMKQWVIDNKVAFEKYAAFWSDGASVVSGSKTGVTTRMKAVNPFIVSIHCAAHRLALVSSQAAKE